MELDNPFYHNYVFRKEDVHRAKIKWWQYPHLFLLPSYVQISDGYVFRYKTWEGAIYVIGFEEINPQ